MTKTKDELLALAAYLDEDAELLDKHGAIGDGNNSREAAALIRSMAEEVAALRADAERWRMASTSRTFGISDWHEFGQRTIYDKLAAERIDAHLAASKQEK